MYVINICPRIEGRKIKEEMKIKGIKAEYLLLRLELSTLSPVTPLPSRLDKNFVFQNENGEKQ